MANQTGIAITITAFLPTGKTLNEQFEALSIVKTAHETGDYAALLSASQDVLVKTENKTRRIPDAIVNAAPSAEEIEQANYNRGFEAGSTGVQAVSGEDQASPGFERGYDAGFVIWQEAQKPEAETPAVEPKPETPAPVASPEIAAAEQPAPRRRGAVGA